MATPKRPAFAPMTKPAATTGIEAKPDPAPAPVARTRPTDSRVTTTLRIEPKVLADLKVVAARRGVKVNDLLLDGAAHVLNLNKQYLTG